MQEDDQKHKDQFDAALPLPLSDTAKSKKTDEKEEEPNPTADLVRKKVEAAYESEPSAQTESHDLEKAGEHKLTKHQKFILELTNSGKPLHEIQMAWHEYYAGLPDEQKHEVWQEFYKTHEQASHYRAATGHKQKPSGEPAKKSAAAGPHRPGVPAKSNAGLTIQNFHRSLSSPPSTKKAGSPLHSLLFGLSVGVIVLIIFLFSFFNERFIAPFIQPSRTASAIPLISSASSISKSAELIIPKINVQIPIIYAADNSDNTIETDLERGVVHYADTAMPGQDGNLVIFGHSSNNIFNPGRYKFAFVLLKRLDKGDTFYIDYHAKRYSYEVFSKKIVSPAEVGVLGPVAGQPATATLITCDPPGTSINRLVVSAAQIDPSPAHNVKASPDSGKAARESQAIAGNGPTLWGRFIHWLWD